MRRRASTLRCCWAEPWSRLRRRLGSSVPLRPMWNALMAAAAARALAVLCSGTCCNADTHVSAASLSDCCHLENIHHQCCTSALTTYTRYGMKG